MVFILPKDGWEEGKKILTWAILWAGFVVLVELGFILWRLV